MKKIIVSFIVSISAVSGVFALPNRFYSLKAEIPFALRSVENNLPIYYKGHKIDLSQGWTKLPECSEPCTFSLLITENVDFSAKGNTVRYLKRIKEQDYAWYDLTLTFHDEPKNISDNLEFPATPKKTYSWEIELNESDAPERIPEHTIVLLTNPNFIAALRTEPALPGVIDIVLPTIVFKDTIDPQEFKETCDTILLGPVLDLDAIHRKDTPSCMTRNGTAVMSLTKKNYETR